MDLNPIILVKKIEPIITELSPEKKSLPPSSERKPKNIGLDYKRKKYIRDQDLKDANLLLSQNSGSCGSENFVAFDKTQNKISITRTKRQSSTDMPKQTSQQLDLANSPRSEFFAKETRENNLKRQKKILNQNAPSTTHQKIPQSSNIALEQAHLLPPNLSQNLKSPQDFYSWNLLHNPSPDPPHPTSPAKALAPNPDQYEDFNHDQASLLAYHHDPHGPQ